MLKWLCNVAVPAKGKTTATCRRIAARKSQTASRRREATDVFVQQSSSRRGSTARRGSAARPDAASTTAEDSVETSRAGRAKFFAMHCFVYNEAYNKSGSSFRSTVKALSDDWAQLPRTHKEKYLGLANNKITEPAFPEPLALIRQTPAAVTTPFSLFVKRHLAQAMDSSSVQSMSSAMPLGNEREATAISYLANEWDTISEFSPEKKGLAAEAAESLHTGETQFDAELELFRKKYLVKP